MPALSRIDLYVRAMPAHQIPLLKPASSVCKREDGGFCCLVNTQASANFSHFDLELVAELRRPKCELANGCSEPQDGRGFLLHRVTVGRPRLFPVALFGAK